MSREIKFRGKRKDNGEWVEGSLVEHNTRTWIVTPVNVSKADPVTCCGLLLCVSYEVLPETVGEFIGLTDENGRKLDWWENDLFKFDVIKNVRQIIYEQGQFVFLSLKTGTKIPCAETVTATWSVLPTKLGNIHENPELLK